VHTRYVVFISYIFLYFMVMVTFQDLIESLLSTDIRESVEINRSVYSVLPLFRF